MLLRHPICRTTYLKPLNESLMKKNLFITLIFFLSYGTHAQELAADDYVIITQENQAYPGFQAKTYRGLFSVGHGQFKMFNYGGTPGNISALGANETLGSFVFNGYDGSSNVISAVIQAKTITDSRDPRINFLLSNGVGSQRPNRMTILGQSGNVGIGTGSPSQTLHLHRSGVNYLKITDGSSNAGGIRLGLNGTGNAYFVQDTPNKGILIGTNGSANSVIDPSGYWGLGTISPSAQLDVDGQIRMRTGAGAGYIPVSDADGKMTWTDPATLNPWTEVSGEVYRPTGNVGIGGNPAARLHIFADGTTKDDGIRLTSSLGTGVDYYMHMNATDDFVIRKDATDVLTLQNATGYVGINTQAPDAQLHVVEATGTNIPVIYGESEYVSDSDRYGVRGKSINNPGYGYGGYFEGGYRGVYGLVNGSTYTGSTYGIRGASTGNAGDRRGVYGSASNSGGNSAYGVYGSASSATNNYGVYGSASGGTTNWAGYFSGNVRVTGTLDNTSDARLKKDIEDMENALDIIKQLQPKTYEFRTNEFPSMGLDARPQLGFIAQDMEEVLPQLVSTAIHPEFTNDERDEYESGIPNSPAVDIKSINYIGIIPVLTQGIKELTAKVEDKEEIIENLIADNEAIKSDIKTVLEYNTGLKSELAAMKEQVSQMAELMNSKFNQMEEDMSSCCFDSNASTPSNGEEAITTIELNGNTDQPILEQNAPNPFNAQTQIRYYIPSSASKSQMIITDNRGAVLKTINLSETGFGTVFVRAGELAPGTYAYTLFVDGNKVTTKQMVLVK
jgi:regulator of replication initiation timing